MCPAAPLRSARRRTDDATGGKRRSPRHNTAPATEQPSPSCETEASAGPPARHGGSLVIVSCYFRSQIPQGRGRASLPADREKDMGELTSHISALSVFLGIAALGFLFLLVSLVFGEIFDH